MCSQIQDTKQIATDLHPCVLLPLLNNSAEQGASELASRLLPNNPFYGQILWTSSPNPASLQQENEGTQMGPGPPGLITALRSTL